MKMNYIVNNIHDNLSEIDKENKFNIKLLKVIMFLEKHKEN